MYTESEYKTALLAIEEHFEVIKDVLGNRIKERCILSDNPEDTATYQAQYKLLSQIETEINNYKE